MKKKDAKIFLKFHFWLIANYDEERERERDFFSNIICFLKKQINVILINNSIQNKSKLYFVTMSKINQLYSCEKKNEEKEEKRLHNIYLYWYIVIFYTKYL